MEKLILLVAEGETDIIVFEAIAQHLSHEEQLVSFLSLAPQKDATSGNYPSNGFGGVLNWCRANRDKVQMLIDFKGASALFIQMDTDIAGQINANCIEEGNEARQCCEAKLNNSFGSSQEPERCHYILPTENTETWLLASHDDIEALDGIDNYENIKNTEQQLINIGYSSRKKVGGRTLNKKPASRYKKYAARLIINLPLARQRCHELDRLCTLLSEA